MMDQAQLLRLIAALQAEGQGAPALPGARTANAAQIVLAALLGRRPAGTAAPPPLSPIDRMLGGEMLVGKKTAIAVLGLAALAMFNPGVLAGGAAVGVAPKITATLLEALGGLGLLAKFDRLIGALSMIATRPQARAATGAVLQQLLAALAARGTMPSGPRTPTLPSPARVPLPPPRPVRPVPLPSPAPVPLPRPAGAPVGRAIVVTGKISTFGGPDDLGVAANEGLALVEPSQMGPLNDCFLQAQPAGTSGLARRLDPEAAYIACRWDYKITPKAYLRAIKVEVTNPQTGQTEWAQPVDWGPHERTRRVADLSPGLARRLGLRTDDACRVVIPLPAGIEAP
jgi:hypothetical protein